MRGTTRPPLAPTAGSWPAWCCSYCSGPLTRRGGGLFCEAEGRWFATDRGVHRLLAEERRREILPQIEFHRRVRRDEAGADAAAAPAGRAGSDSERRLWARLARGLSLVEPVLGSGRWDVLDVGSGRGWAGLRLLERGHRIAAVDLSLDPEDGLAAAENRLEDPEAFPRAEADMEELPLEAASFDLVLAVGSLHHAERAVRTLVELRRVTRRGGALLVLESPVFRRRFDGEAMVEARMRSERRRYRFSVPRESQPSYLVLGEAPELFRTAGWDLEIHGWPSLPWELAGDVLALLRTGRRRPRHPILLARREG